MVDGRDVPAIALAALAMLSDRAAAAAMGATGRAFTEERWQWRHMAARLEQLL